MHYATQRASARGRSTKALIFAAALSIGGFGAATRASAAFPAGPIAAAAVGQGDFGSIKGRLVWGGDTAPPAKALKEKGAGEKDPTMKDPTVCAAKAAIPDNKLVVDPKTLGVKYGFAYLVRPKGANPDAVKALVGKKAQVVIDQVNCEFLPYAVGMHQDQTLVFKSSDPVNHNIHLSPFDNAPFNQMLGPGGTLEKKLVAERRVIQIACDIHPWMKGWVMVFDHPFFAVTDTDGSFEIKGVPAGDFKLVVWQEATGYVTAGNAAGMPVSVKAGEATDLGAIKLNPAKVKK